MYISDTSLCDYENTEKDKNMSVKNLVALAKFYGVSYEYLLGETPSRQRENIDIERKYGLSDETLNRIELMTMTHSTKHSISLIKAFNRLVENDEFSGFIDALAQCRLAYAFRENSYSVRQNAADRIKPTITDEQKQLIDEGIMIIMDPTKYFDVVISNLQYSAFQIGMDLAKREDP